MRAPPRDARARAAGVLLWVLLWTAIVTVVVMTWHPWVIGDPLHCAAGQRAGWDGRCRTSSAGISTVRA